MSRLLDQLTPQERRLAVGIGVGFFIFVNYWWVWSHFGDLKREEGRMEGAQRTLAIYKKELSHTNEYLTKIQTLQTTGGDSVPEEDQAIEFERYLRRRATESGVAAGIQGNSRPVTRTNEFFVDQEMTLNIVTEEKNLVDFLASLGSSNSLVRVRAMDLRPDAAHQQLNATLTILASYQRKAPAPVPTVTAAAKTIGKPLVALPTHGTAAPKTGAPPPKQAAHAPGTPGGPPKINNGFRPRPSPQGTPLNPGGLPPGGRQTNSGAQSSKFKPRSSNAP